MGYWRVGEGLAKDGRETKLEKVMSPGPPRLIFIRIKKDHSETAKKEYSPSSHFTPRVI